MRVRKTEPGQGLKIGKRLAAIVPLFKVTIVVDEDVDILNWYEVGLAMGARYTPATSTEIFAGRGMPLDPSSADRGESSKIVIDATRQLPEEGGPDVYPELNRTLLENLAPDAFDIAMEQYVTERSQAVALIAGGAMAGGIGGSYGVSPWWAVLMLPYPIGWSMGIWGPGSPR